MVLILDGKSNISAHVRSEFDSLICSRRLFGSKAVASLIFLEEISEENQSKLREAAKSSFFLVARPLREGGGMLKARPLRKRG